MVILPGGQYAERGLALNLPVNINHIMTQLQNMKNDNALCMVHFAAQRVQPKDVNYLIRPHILQSAFKWLKQNNHLYTNFDLNSTFVNNEHHTTSTSETNEDITSDNVDALEENAFIGVDYQPPDHNQGDIRSHNLYIPKSTYSPVAIYEIDHGEEHTFPWLFPSGRNGFTENRQHQIGFSMYLKARLLNYKKPWCKDITYLLHAATASDVLQLKRQIGTYMRMTKSSTNNSAINLRTAEHIRSMSDKSDILHNSYMFMNNIRGTVAYFRNALNNLLAMLRTIGPPTLFVTLSADDLH